MFSTSALRLWKRQSGAGSQQWHPQGYQVSGLSGTIEMLLTTTSTSDSCGEDRHLMQGPCNRAEFTLRATCAITLLDSGVWLPCDEQ